VIRSNPTGDTTTLTIVGVSPTIPHFLPGTDGPSQSHEPASAIYVPMSADQEPARAFSLVTRTHPGVSAVPAVQKALRVIDPNLPVYFVRPMGDIAADMRYVTLVLGEMILMFATIAWVLASVGLYATTAHSVTTRTQEIGVRMAIGARVAAITWLFLRRTFLQILIGVAIGMGGATAASDMMAAYLTETRPHDPVALATSVVVLGIVSISACLIAVRRAARLDPATALRYE
jgi:ABC-type antimicrobial peptide transport system permease subunit